MTSSRTWVLLIVFATLASGCAAPIGVRHASPEAVHRQLTGSVLSTGELSGFTQITLRQHDLEKGFEEAPEAALATLHERLVRDVGDTDDLVALAELSYFWAQESKSKPHFLAAAVYAYAYLFPADNTKRPDPFDSRFRLACDLYNRALTEAFEAPDGERVVLAAGTYALPFGSMNVSFDEAQLLWGNRRLKDFVPTSELEITGFQNRYRQPGIGAPLAAKTEPAGASAAADAFVGPRVRVSATALLRLDDPRTQLAGKDLQGTLELHAATSDERVVIDGISVPLEREPTATLAQTLAESRPWDTEISAFLGAVLNVQQRPLQLAAREPYRPGRIPVVFVHGTASSVTRWADMVNDLDADPLIRNRFQFWFFSYDSGGPIAYSALVLRQHLQKAIATLDPQGHDECLHRMVVMGHSQGGLLTKMMAIDSGDRFWRNMSDTPLDQLDISEKTRDFLREGMFVQPLPFVKRVVFIATPHRGSYLAGPDIIRRLAQRMVSLPATLLQSGSDLLTRDDVKPYLKMQTLPTSIDNMSPGHPFIKVISSIPVVPGVTAHSIIGISPPGPKETGGDGVVKYMSAHIDEAVSEVVVNSPHSMQSHPEVVGEVQRILRLHAAENQCALPAP